jgi:hypothetical protein
VAFGCASISLPAYRDGVIPICNQKVAYWYEGDGNRRPQVFENAGFARVFKNFGVQRSKSFERNLVLIPRCFEIGSTVQLNI